MGRALLPNRPTVKQENKGKFGGGGGGGGGEGEASNFNLLSSADDFWGFTDRD